MNIALIGYGKMGRTIERIATGRGHRVVLRATTEDRTGLTPDALRAADVAIEFTAPDAAEENVRLCIEADVPVVSGTTGWSDALKRLQDEVRASGRGALIHATNFSVGVNILFGLAEQLARWMDRQPEYDLRIEETHHTEKKDAPSGTAITLAERSLAGLQRKTGWVLGEAQNRAQLGIQAFREAGVPGTHRLIYSSAVDEIEVMHTAHNRDGFALGAVLAAEFLIGKTGVFSMHEVLGL